MSKSIYLIGSMKNDRIPQIAKELREMGFDVFDDWYSPGPDADDYWQAHEKLRGRTYKQALNGYHAKDVFEFDKRHLDRCDMAIMIMPAGKSGHLEVGYVVGKGKRVFILFDREPDRYDIMYQFANDIFFTKEELKEELKKWL